MTYFPLPNKVLDAPQRQQRGDKSHGPERECQGKIVVVSLCRVFASALKTKAMERDAPFHRSRRSGQMIEALVRSQKIDRGEISSVNQLHRAQARARKTATTDVLPTQSAMLAKHNNSATTVATFKRMRRNRRTAGLYRIPDTVPASPADRTHTWRTSRRSPAGAGVATRGSAEWAGWRRG
jgi:hypothetical protein